MWRTTTEGVPLVSEWLSTSWVQAGLVVGSTLAIYAALIAIVRVNGLRSFSKMSSFDFATTVAAGSLVATVAVSSSSLTNGVIALTTMFGAQRLVARGRFRPRLAGVVDNQPVLLMMDGEFVQDGLDAARITEHDVIAKLRGQGVTRIENVAAVVVEVTGDVSVLHGADAPPNVDPCLYSDVRFADRLDARRSD